MSNTLPRVVITGMGLVSPVGNSPETLWERLKAGESGIDELKSVPTEFLPTTFGGEAREFTGHIDDFGPLEKTIKRNIRKGLKVMCREIEMGVAAAQLALSHANLSEGAYDPERTGAVYGSDYIMTLPDEFTAGIKKCLDSDGQFEFNRWAEEGMPEVTPLWLLKYLPNMPASHIAIYNDLRGPNNSITLREASANLAIAEAYHTIARGSADTIIAGATGTRIHPLRTIHVVLQEEIASGNDSPATASRPFDKERSGMVIAEGAGAIVLERLETAQARGATILGEVIGHGASTVLGRDCVAKIDVALKNAMNQAIRTSDVTPDEIGHVHAHGLSTHKSDREEAIAINDVFGDRSNPVPVASAKSYFGNLGAGSGLVELISSVMAMNDGNLFRTLNYEHPDDECSINVVNTDDVSAGDSFLNANVTPQGQASAVVIRKFAA